MHASACAQLHKCKDLLPRTARQRPVLGCAQRETCGCVRAHARACVRVHVCAMRAMRAPRRAVHACVRAGGWACVPVSMMAGGSCKLRIEPQDEGALELAVDWATPGKAIAEAGAMAQAVIAFGGHGLHR